MFMQIKREKIGTVSLPRVRTHKVGITILDNLDKFIKNLRSCFRTPQSWD